MHLAAGRLREQRKNKGHRQSEAAEQLGVHLNTLSRWETGDVPTSLDHFLSLADYLEVTCDDLRSLLFDPAPAAKAA